MKASNKALLVKYARLGLQHATDLDADDRARIETLLKWTESGITGEWEKTARTKRARVEESHLVEVGE